MYILCVHALVKKPSDLQVSALLFCLTRGRFTWKVISEFMDHATIPSKVMQFQQLLFRARDKKDLRRIPSRIDTLQVCAWT